VELNEVRDGLIAAGIPLELVRELLETYTEAKRRYHLGDLPRRRSKVGGSARPFFVSSSTSVVTR
jgi:hypothetical protein